MKICTQCELPISDGAAIVKEIRGEKLSFCCSGCSLTYSITGEKGQEGISMLYVAKMALGGFFAMNVMMLSFLTYSSDFTQALQIDNLHNLNNWLQLILATPVILILGIPYLRSAIQNRRFDTDTLIAIGTFTAFFFSIYQIFIEGKVYFDTACMILFLVTTGRLLESSGKARAARVLEKLKVSLPDTVIQIQNDQEIEVPLQNINTGDIIKVKTGQRIPADGTVLWETVAVNEAMFTGESKWIEKAPNSKVYAGTIVVDGILTMKVEQIGEQTALAHIQRLSQMAKLRETRLQKLVDKIASYFTPTVLIIALFTFLGWWFIEKNPVKGFESALAVLIVACPCALGLATPIAQYLALSKTAEIGVIVQDLDVLDKLHLAKRIYYDKTGTITEAKFTLHKEVWLKDKFTFLPYLLAIEQQTNHPLAKAILDHYKKIDLTLPNLENVQSHVGKGVTAYFGGKEILCGSEKFCVEKGIEINKTIFDQPEDLPTVYFAVDKNLVAVFTFEDKIRDDFRVFQEKIHELYIEEVILTGDHEKSARRVAQQLNIRKYRHSLLPQDKLDILKQDKEVHIMLADGINDAPALAQAEIGVAVSKAEDIAKQSADIILMGDLLQLIELIRLSKFVRGIVRSNLFWAFFYNIIAIGLAVMGYINPVFSAIAMVASSLFVLVNSNRIYHWS
ncbi:MAG: cation-translocating P-type ATPase [Bacteroidia bacterium]|nr:cation-translocating P-type ATPase [Bacteroidia bacterium]MDW8301485.1 cation-translocating P-type ATPase [Bacteroidia bacterium]